jgi:AcrR family transcriptional regulator
MARPRKDSPEPPARERIIEAFWELIIDTPIEQITVKMLTEKSRCNRSTFYRHFEDIYDVVERIESDLKLSQLPGMIVQALRGGERPYLIAELIQEEQHFDRLCLLLSRNGNPGYRRRFKDGMLAAWANEFDFDPDEFDLEARVFLEFCVNGVVGILTYRGDTNLDLDFTDIAGLMLGEVAPTLLGLLQKNVLSSKRSLRRQIITRFLAAPRE